MTKRSDRFYRRFAGAIRAIIKTFTVSQWRGAEYLPKHGGFIVAANHNSSYDPIADIHFLFDHGYLPRVMAKIELFKIPGLRFVMRKIGVIPVSRGSLKALESLNTAQEALESGQCILLFPEGTITRDPNGWPMVAKNGVARMALTAKVPVIPLAQWGAATVFPHGGHFPRLFPRKRIVAQAGPAVDLTDLYDRRLDGKTMREAAARIMGAVTAQMAEIRDEEPPSFTFDMRIMGDPFAKPSKKSRRKPREGERD